MIYFNFCKKFKKIAVNNFLNFPQDRVTKMCERFSLTPKSSIISERFGVSFTNWQPRYNIAPSQICPIIILDNQQRRLDFMQWGLIPHWSDDQKIGESLFNSNVESMKSEPIFCKLFQSKRCLVPADGFIEWKRATSGKIPFRISLKNDQLFSFAGLWDIWHKANGDQIKSFTILTTEANPLVGELHYRMPILLRKECEDFWLDPNATDEQLEEALTPIAPKDMTLYEVSNIVNSGKVDHSKCIQPMWRLF